MRYRAADLARRQGPGRLDRDDFGVIDRDRCQQVADASRLELREEPEDRERGVEVDVHGVVEPIVQAFQEGEPARLAGLWFGPANLTSLPERATIDQEIELVEEGALVPVGAVGGVEDRTLPCLDRIAPGRRCLQRMPGEVEGARAGPAPRPRVALPPLAPGPELDGRQVPGDRKTDRAALAGTQLQRGRHGGADRLAVLVRGVVVVRFEPSIGREVGPQLGIGERIEA